jgi:hypothetical protein
MCFLISLNRQIRLAQTTECIGDIFIVGEFLVVVDSAGRDGRWRLVTVIEGRVLRPFHHAFVIDAAAYR